MGSNRCLSKRDFTVYPHFNCPNINIWKANFKNINTKQKLINIKSTSSWLAQVIQKLLE